MQGRPTKHTQDLADRLCDQLADGKSLRKVCESDEFPSKTTIFNWLRTNESFLDQYTRAKTETADSHVDDLVDGVENIGSPVLDDDGKAVMIKGKPLMVVDMVAIAHAKLIAETKKWAAIKLSPKKYGEKIDLTTAGEKITFNSNFGNGN
jgi:hypothetical protein